MTVKAEKVLNEYGETQFKWFRKGELPEDSGKKSD